ncbi:MAG TPA: NUDIX domain-containing protein [Nitrosopumilaceae archaeon]|nr:NUDIX domain-containing protein [Nitrosopumilaceae archaeon]
MIEERSSGAVLFSETSSGRIFLLLNYPSGHWDFVKGNIENGETPRQTVIREIKEETCIVDVEFVNGFEDKIEYHYRRDGNIVHKEVVFFLAKTKTTDVKISHEHLGFVWLSFNDALKKLTYKNAQNVLKKVKKLGLKT